MDQPANVRDCFVRFSYCHDLGDALSERLAVDPNARVIDMFGPFEYQEARNVIIAACRVGVNPFCRDTVEAKWNPVHSAQVLTMSDDYSYETLENWVARDYGDTLCSGFPKHEVETLDEALANLTFN